jgi:putative transposase
LAQLWTQIRFKMAQFWMPFNIKANTCVDILMRQSKYLDSIVEQDHRTSKRMTWPMLDLKSFWSARILIVGSESMHMIRKGQMDCLAGQTMSAAPQLYSLPV